LIHWMLKAGSAATAPFITFFSMTRLVLFGAKRCADLCGIAYEDL
jgi:hypothetical protein